MRGISVLLVHASAAGRRTLVEALGNDPRVGSVASAANAAIALRKIPQLNPDVVLVDLDREGEALATVRTVRAEYPDLALVVDDEGGRGRDGLVPALLDACAVPRVRLDEAATGGRGHRADRAHARPEVLALGASTGGPEALEAVLTGLPTTFRLPVVVVQHMPAGFTRQFARRLASRCALPVREAVDGDPVVPGTVLLAPGGLHMRVSPGRGRRVVRLDHGTPENFCRPSVDVLFRSVAAAYAGTALAVVLTGMGSDGLRGADDLVAAGSEVLVQDEESSTVWGMPGAVSRAGLASAILPLVQIAPAILRRVDAPRRTEVHR